MYQLYLSVQLLHCTITFLLIHLDSLKPFTTDICGAIDVNTILPFMVKNGLLSSSQHQYFLNPYHTTYDKQNKLTCIAVTLNEDCVERFLQCLQETSEYEPHETLLKKIRIGKKIHECTYRNTVMAKVFYTSVIIENLQGNQSHAVCRFKILNSKGDTYCNMSRRILCT